MSPWQALWLFFRAGTSPTLGTLAAFLVAVVLAVILPVADEALVDAEPVLTVVASGGAEQRVCCCGGKGEQVTREASRSPRKAPEPSLAQRVSFLGSGELAHLRRQLT